MRSMNPTSRPRGPPSCTLHGHGRHLGGHSAAHTSSSILPPSTDQDPAFASTQLLVGRFFEYIRKAHPRGQPPWTPAFSEAAPT